MMARRLFVGIGVLTAGCQHTNLEGFQASERSADGDSPNGAMWFFEVPDQMVLDAVGGDALQLCSDRLAAGAQSCSLELSGCVTLVVWPNRPVSLVVGVEECSYAEMRREWTVALPSGPEVVPIP